MRPIEIVFVPLDWERFGDVLELSFDVLYRPFGLSWPAEGAPGSEWLHPDPGTLVAVALDAGGELLGSARLLPHPGDTSRQVRQVAVVEGARGRGVGRGLMLALETQAAEQGAGEIWLNARNSAYGFYESLGYVLEGDEFISAITGIPHRAARKRLSGAAGADPVG